MQWRTAYENGRSKRNFNFFSNHYHAAIIFTKLNRQRGNEGRLKNIIISEIFKKVIMLIIAISLKKSADFTTTILLC